VGNFQFNPGIFSLLKPVEINPAKTAAEYANLAALAQQRQLRQQQMLTSQQEQQMNALKYQEAQQDWQDTQTMRTVLPQMLKDPQYQTQDGQPDYEKIHLDLAGKVSPKTADAFYASVIKNKDSAADVQKKTADAKHALAQADQLHRQAEESFSDHMGNLATDWREKGSSIPALHGMIAVARSTWGADTPEHQTALDGFEKAITDNPAAAGEIMQRMEDNLSVAQRTARSEQLQKGFQAGEESIRYKLFQKAQQGGPEDKASTIDTILPKDKFPVQNANYNAMLRQAGAGMTDPNQIAAAQNAVLQHALSWMQQNSPEAQQAAANKARLEAEATEASKSRVAKAGAVGRAEGVIEASGLTPDDINREGEIYARTGVMQVGRSPLLQQKIIAASHEWQRQHGISPAEAVVMRAAYAGDKKSLADLQTKRDQIVSFEQTAQKNLDLFLDAAKKIPDTGLPWLNLPLRMLDEKLAGSENMAAVNAARQVANNEIAKVTSGGGLSGVLSDSARHEVEAYNPKNATLKQTLRVAQILRQDMANRHSSMDNALGDIKSRMASGGGQVEGGQQTGPKATVRFNPKTGKLEPISQ